MVGGPAGITLGAAGPALGVVIIGILPLLKKGSEIPDAQAEVPPADILEPPVDVDVVDDDKDDDNKEKIKKYLPYVAVGIVAIVGGYFLLKRKK